MAVLWSIPQSPWSLRVRWLLAHHHIEVAHRSLVPMIGELRLRAEAGRWRGRVTLPLLRADDGTVLADSWDIACWADARGEGERLLPADEREVVRRWNDVADAIAECGRALVTPQVLHDREALLENLAFLPAAVRPAFGWLARVGAAWLAAKYGYAGADRDALLARQDAALREVWEGLRGRDHLLDHFTYADVVVALALQLVRPTQVAALGLGPGGRRAWKVEPLATVHADLLVWRDAVLRRHLPAPLRDPT